MKSTSKGMVEISDDKQAKTAIAALQGKMLSATPLLVKEYKEKSKL